MDEVDEPQQPQQPQPPSLLDHLAGAGDPDHDPDATAAHEPVDPPYESVEYEVAEYEAVGYEVEADAEADAEAEDDEDSKKRRVPLSTKLLLVGAGWVLLTFFLIGVFDKDGKKDDSVRLSQAPGAATQDEAAGDDGGDGADGSNASGGDGVEEGDADATVEAYPGRTVAGGESGSSGSATAAGGSAGGGSAGGTGGTSGGGTSGGSGGTTATTTRSGGGTGGSSTSTTAAPTGGGGGGGGGSPSTTATTRPPSTTATTAPAESVTIRTTDFSRNAVSISKGQTVEFYNSTLVKHTLKIEDQPGTVEVDPGERVSVLFTSKGKFRVVSETGGHVGHCDVTVD